MMWLLWGRDPSPENAADAVYAVLREEKEHLAQGCDHTLMRIQTGRGESVVSL